MLMASYYVVIQAAPGFQENIGQCENILNKATPKRIRIFLNPQLFLSGLIIHMKKLLDSDWLRAVQFKCNTSAKSVTPVQITHRNSG